MSLYAELADLYEAVFPLQPAAYAFLRRHWGNRAELILDIGCGPGHYCGRLAAEGRAVMGIDRDQAMIAAARRHYPRAIFRRLDIRRLEELDCPLSGAFSLGNVLAHLPREDLARMLSALAARLCPGGPWIVQLINWDQVLAHTVFEFPVKEVPARRIRFYRTYRDLSENAARFCTRLELNGRPVFTEETGLYPLRAGDCVALHQAAGFELEGHYADYQRTPFAEKAGMGSIYVFRRQATGEAGT